MAMVASKLPQRYQGRLDAAHARLDLFAERATGNGEAHQRPDELLYPHAVWFLHAGKLLEGATLAQSSRRGAWAYYFRDGRRMTCALLQIAPGRQESISFSEGPFVRKIVGLIEKAERDPRLKGKKLELRVLMAPALHFACLWLRGAKGVEHFVVATPGRERLKFGRWLSRAELHELLLAQTERVRAAQRRRDELLAQRRATQAGLARTARSE